MNTQDVQNLIKELITKLNIEVTNISAEGDNWFSVEVNDPNIFISRDGEGLMALNHVVRKILEPKGPRTDEQEPGVTIDINGFQKKRIDSIKAVAHMMAERARYFKSNIEVEPMSSFERRIVHEFLANEADLKTESVGMGPQRRVVIKYIGAI